MAANPFDLNKKKVGGVAAKRAHKEFTKDEQKLRLVDYVLVESKYWPLIRYNSHIRYYTKNGEYHNGGFIAAAATELKDTEGVFKKIIKLQSAPFRGANHFEWTVDLEDIAEIYVKLDALSSQIIDEQRATIQSINTNFLKIRGIIAELQAKIAALKSSP